MAPDPAPAPAGGDYAGWTWQQIQSAIIAGQPQSFYDAGTAFDNAHTKLVDIVTKSTAGTNALTGPDGTWSGPASESFTGLMTKLTGDVDLHAKTLAGPPSYKETLDTAGEELQTAQTDVQTAMTEAGTDTVNRYKDDVTTYNTAVGKYNAGTGPKPPDLPPSPYVQDNHGGTTVDVARYPEIEAVLNGKLRGIIAKLAGQYKAGGAQMIAPDNAPPPNPKDVLPPALVPARDLPVPEIVPPTLPAPDPNVPLPTDTLFADNVPPPNPFAPPNDVGPLAPGIGNLALVTQPGGLANLPPDVRALPPPSLLRIDPLAAPAPLAAGTENLPGARFNGVLGDRPLLITNNSLTQPGDVPLHNLVPTELTAPGTIGGPPIPVRNTLLGAAPVGFITVSSGLTAPNLTKTTSTSSTPGVLGSPESINATSNNLFTSGGQQHLTESVPPSLAGRSGNPSSQLGGGMPPMAGMGAGGFGGMTSVGPDGKNRMLLDDDVFAEDEEGLAKARERSRVSEPDQETPFAGVYVRGDDDEEEREHEYVESTDDMWGTTACAAPLGR